MMRRYKPAQRRVLQHMAKFTHALRTDLPEIAQLAAAHILPPLADMVAEYADDDQATLNGRIVRAVKGELFVIRRVDDVWTCHRHGCATGVFSRYLFAPTPDATPIALNDQSLDMCQKCYDQAKEEMRRELGYFEDPEDLEALGDFEDVAEPDPVDNAVPLLGIVKYARYQAWAVKVSRNQEYDGREVLTLNLHEHRQFMALYHWAVQQSASLRTK
jgi:hypothetical protein